MHVERGGGVADRGRPVRRQEHCRHVAFHLPAQGPDRFEPVALIEMVVGENRFRDDVLRPDCVDCALQIFPAASQELVSRPLFPVRRVFCATPAYLEAHGMPENPRELHRHTLGLYSGYPTRDRWTFHHRGEQITIYLAAALLTNSVHLLREYALEHAGIVCLPTLVAGDAIRRGDLRVVLAEHQLSSFPLSAVYANTSRKAFKLRLFIEHIGNEFAHDPPWDAALIEKGLIPAELIEA